MQILNEGYTFWGILIAANVLMYVATVLVSYIWSKVFKHKTLALTKHDLLNSFLVVGLNILVAVPGYFLFTHGSISFTSTENFIRDFLLLFFVFDIVMYLLHLVSHYVWPFKKFHAKHHSHEYFNAISLYVMEPIEVVLFGGLLTVCAFFVSLNIFSFLAFLFVNWALGVIGHLNTNSMKQPLLFGNHIFHKTHHKVGNNNFGFYTVIWDKLFGTIYKE